MLDTAEDMVNKYGSQSYFNLEQKTLFRKNWVCAGFGYQVPNPGDLAPVVVGGSPLILVRQKDKSISVFHNVCRHRGATIATKACSHGNLIRCPYHSWAYALDGELKQRPHFDGPEQHVRGGEGLWPVRSAMWCDLVFVNLDGSACPFDDFIAPLRLIGDAFGVAEALFDEAISIDIPVNWKLLVENFVDGYHIASVHPTLEKSVPTKTHKFRQDSGLFIGEAPRRTHEAGSGGGSYVSGLPDFVGITDEARDKLVYMSVFPNLCINMTSDRFSIYLMQPVSPSMSLEVISNFYAPSAFTPETESIRQQMTQNQLAFNEEDIAILKQLQDGRSSDIYDGGHPSTYWDQNAEMFLDMCSNNTRR